MRVLILLVSALLSSAVAAQPNRLTTARLDVVMDDHPYEAPAIDRIEDIRELARSVVAGTSLANAEIVVGGPIWD